MGSEMCIRDRHLAELEALQEEKNPTLPGTPASPPRDKPARAHAGKVRQVAGATGGQGQESAEPASPRRGPVTSGRKRRASSSGSDTSERSLRDEIQEGFRNLGRDLRSLTIRVDRAGNRSPGKPPLGGSRQRANHPSGSSKEQTCFLCGAADHWKAECPGSNLKGDGTDTGFNGPSQTQDS